MCPSVKVTLNQLKHTEGYAVIHTVIDKADGALEPLLSLFISVAISDTLVLFLCLLISITPLSSYILAPLPSPHLCSSLCFTVSSLHLSTSLVPPPPLLLLLPRFYSLCLSAISSLFNTHIS